MNTVQLTAVMDEITCNTYFLGVLPCDYLLKTPLNNLPAMVIFNTDPSTEPGQHWVAIYINSDGVSCFFDSFGGAPKDPHFRRTSMIFKKTILYVWNTLKSRSKISHQILVASIVCFFCITCQKDMLMIILLKSITMI